MTSRSHRILILLALVIAPTAIGGCDSPTPTEDAGASADTDAGSQLDGGTSDDGGANNGTDGGATVDSGSVAPGVDAGDDAGSATDSGVDGGESFDAGERRDGGANDAGTMHDGGPSTDGGPNNGPFNFTVVTFNTGTGTTNGVDDDGDAWTSTEQGIGDTHFGNGLAWLEAIDGTRAFFANLQPDIVAFQEIFHPGECDGIPTEFHPGFVCSDWPDDALTVAQRVLGPEYQVACNLGKPDKCAAVKRSFGTFRGCSDALCLDHLDGVPVPDCGGGSRLGRATIDLERGGELTVVTVHGNSGFTSSDAECRIAQVEQVFVDLDGEPAANGTRNIVLGDLNTDPGRATLLDSSAERWTDFVGDTEAFHFISDVGFGVDPTYGNSVNIDHVISDVFAGSCTAPGVTAGLPPVLSTVHFDHTPIICSLTEP